MRNYKKKTERGQTPKDVMDEAITRVISNNESIRAVAKDTNICYVTLSRYVKKHRQRSESAVGMTLDNYGYSKHKQVFTEDQLNEFVKYLKHCSKIYFGLSPQDVRKLAYECAVSYNIKVPESWLRDKSAGEDWLTTFLKKHTSLSIRIPEPTSIGRATNFNKPNVKMFFDKLADVRDRFNFEAADIWNVDETGLTTVQRLGKVVAEKGTKQVGGVTSSERGVLVTLCVAVSAIGNHVPPMFLFPRKRYQDHFIRDGPPGSIGAGNGSGWITEDEFFIFMKHFVSHVRPTKEKPILLLLDNHDSHTSYRTVEYAKQNGVILLSFPPHCSHRLQPLDRSVYGPLKKYMTSQQDAWMRNNPMKFMTIYDIPGLAREALPRALTPNNITNGFSCTGIEPFNRNIFSDEDFLPASVTDRPFSGNVSTEQLPDSVNNLQVLPSTSTSACSVEHTSNSPELSRSGDSRTIQCFPSTSGLNTAAIIDSGNQGSAVSSNTVNQCSFMSSSSSDVFSPANVRPIPTAAERKPSTRGRKKRKSAILTDTPEINALKLEKEKRDNKKGKRAAGVKNSKTVRRQVFQKESSDEDDTVCVVCCENFSDSKPGESWIRCQLCKQWAHEECTPGDETYICHHCNSDDDEDQ